MNRLLFFVIVLYVIWRLLTIVGRRLSSRSAGAEDFSRFSARRRGRGDEAGGSERLVACAVCGTLVPASRALPAGNGRRVCGEACLRGDGVSAGSPVDTET